MFRCGNSIVIVHCEWLRFLLLPLAIASIANAIFNIFEISGKSSEDDRLDAAEDLFGADMSTLMAIFVLFCVVSPFTFLLASLKISILYPSKEVHIIEFKPRCGGLSITRGVIRALKRYYIPSIFVNTFRTHKAYSHLIFSIIDENGERRDVFVKEMNHYIDMRPNLVFTFRPFSWFGYHVPSIASDPYVSFVNTLSRFYREEKARVKNSVLEPLLDTFSIIPSTHICDFAVDIKSPEGVNRISALDLENEEELIETFSANIVNTLNNRGVTHTLMLL